MEKYLHNHCDERPIEKPRYTITEEVEHTVRLMRDTIDRVMRLEDRMKRDFEDLSRTVASDNVIFKTTMRECWETFSKEVKNEMNVFESQLESMNELFKTDVEGNYSKLSEEVNLKVSELSKSVQEQYDALVESINSRLDAYNVNHGTAFEDFQRHVTTEINTFEQTINTNMSAFMETISNTVETFENTWTGIVEERLNTQDARISDAEMYMKTNLTATATALIGDMADNGEFVDIIEGEVFNSLDEKIESSRKGYFNLTSMNIDEAVETCKEQGKIAYIPHGETLVLSETLDLRDMNVLFEGTVKVDFDGIGIIVGGKSSMGENLNIVINEVIHTNYISSNVSVRVNGLTRGQVTLNKVPYIELYADGGTEYGAIGYSNFNIGTCRKLVLTDNPDGSSIGWINENIFVVNRVTEGLAIIGNTFCHDNNVFLKPCLEGAGLTLKNCCRNKFYDIRTEGDFTADFDSKTKYNYCLGNFHWASVQALSGITDNGRNNIFTNSIYEGMEHKPVYIINEKNIDKYEVYAREKFVCENGEITPSTTYSKLLLERVIPVDGISFIGFEADRGCFQMYVTPLDANGDLLTNNPLDYTGGVKQQANGQYNPSDATATAFVEIVSPHVKFLKVTIDTCPTETMSFKNFVLYALAKKHNANKLHILCEELKV